jgi:ABC-type transport system substrate-binding protein
MFRVNPETGSIQHSFPNLGASAFAHDDGSIWMAGGAPGVSITRLDPGSNTVAATAELPGGSDFVAAGGGFGWTADEVKGVVYKIDQRGNLVDTYTTGQGAREVSFAAGVLWVANQDVGTVSGIDAVTGARTTYRFEHPLQALAAGSGSLLVQLKPGRTYEDRIDALEGKVAKFLVGAFQLDGDPATSWTPLAYEVEFATCANLLHYPDSAGPKGWNLQPEVAASMPEVSADGRTFRFRVRPGYRFSPPSNEDVTAETFRHSIERALSPALGNGWWGEPSPGAIYVDDIQGENRFLAGKADHISGLRAQGDTLTVTLTRPSPDLLQRLTMPFFCPVPTDTSIVSHSAVIPTSGGGGMVPSAGPYYIADAFNGEYAILKRNPNYTGPRPHDLDAIALREGIDPGQAVGRVQSATWDGLTNLGDPILNSDGQVAKSWGPGGTSASNGDQRYYPMPDGGLEYLDLNAGRPLFSHRSIRRAVAYALDRKALARIAGSSAPTDQLLPPIQSGFQDAGPYPLDGPNLEKAKALMHGRTGTAVLAVFPGTVEPEAQEIKADLARIGITVRFSPVEGSQLAAIHEPGAPYDLKIGFSPANPGDPQDSTVYLQQSLSALPPDSALTSVLPTEWESPAVRAAAAQILRAPNEAAVLEILRGSIMEEVPMTGIRYTVSGTFFAPRIGCRKFPPASYGVDLAALCLMS